MDPLKSIKLWLERHLAPSKVVYPLIPEPIDVVIPCVEKDLETLEASILAMRKYGEHIRRIIVVSQKPLTKLAEWFPEEDYPFSKRDISLEIFGHDKKRADEFMQQKNSRLGWIYQQLLKLYAPLVIPEISSNVLILDSDVIFLKKTTFMTDKGEPLFNVGKEWHKPYFEHARKLLPFLHRVYPQYSGVCHHMLFQKAIIFDLFAHIKRIHQLEAWQAICRMIDHDELFQSALSEYEIYFNFALLRTHQAKIRPLKWVDLDSAERKEQFIQEDYDYMACQSWRRDLNISEVVSHAN